MAAVTTVTATRVPWLLPRWTRPYAGCFTAQEGRCQVAAAAAAAAGAVVGAGTVRSAGAWRSEEALDRLVP